MYKDESRDSKKKRANRAVKNHGEARIASPGAAVGEAGSRFHRRCSARVCAGFGVAIRIA